MAANPNDPCQCGGVFTIRSKSGAYFLGCSNYGSKKCTQQRTLKHRIEVYQGASPSATPGASSAAGSQEHASPVALKLQPDAGISVSPGSAGSLAARDAPPSYLSPVPVKREAAPSYQSPGKREAAPPAAGEGGPAKPGGTCSKCGGIWIIKSNSWTGANFLGCSNYWSTKKCKNTAVYQGASPSATHGTSSSQQAARSQAQTSPAALKIEHASGISASPGSAGSLSARDAPPHQSPAPGKREATATLATGAGGSTLAPLPSRDAAGVSASTGATRDPPPLLSPPPGKREAPPPYQSPGKREAVGISASTGATGTLATRDAPPPYHSPLPVKREAAAPPAGAGAGAGGSAKKPRGGDTAGAKGAKGAKGAAKGWTLEDDEAVLVDPGVPDSIRRCIEELVGRSRGEVDDRLKQLREEGSPAQKRLARGEELTPEGLFERRLLPADQPQPGDGETSGRGEAVGAPAAVTSSASGFNPGGNSGGASGGAFQGGAFVSAAVSSSAGGFISGGNCGEVSGQGGASRFVSNDPPAAVTSSAGGFVSARFVSRDLFRGEAVAVPQEPKFFTPEQARVLEHVPKDCEIVQILAGASTGKTFTLLELAARFCSGEKPRSVLYLVYSKAAQEDFERRKRDDARLGGVQCLTIHGCAFRNLRKRLVPVADAREESDEMKERYEQILEPELESLPWGNAFNPNLKNNRSKTLRTRVLKTFANWCHSDMPPDVLTRSHDPANKADAEELRVLLKEKQGTTALWQMDPKTGTMRPTDECPKVELPEGLDWYLRQAHNLWVSITTLGVDHETEIGEYKMDCDCYLKWTQIQKLPLLEDVILLDEVQDVTPCALAFCIVQQPDRIRYLVGDFAQSIDAYRGANGREIFTSLTANARFSLTKSFRFGANIARCANALLVAKAQSNQRRNFEPYTLETVSPEDGGPVNGTVLFQDGKLLLTKVTYIGRTNAKLFEIAIKLLDAAGDTRLTIVSSIKKAKLKVARELYNLKNGGGPWRKVHTWKDLCNRMERGDFADLKMEVGLVQIHGEKLLGLLDRYEREVYEANNYSGPFDVMLTTAHKAKGLEWDTVFVLDDFISLDLVKERQPQTAQLPRLNEEREEEQVVFNYEWKAVQVKQIHSLDFMGRPQIEEEFSDANPDEWNCLYVAVTRARKELHLPLCFRKFAQSLCDAINNAARDPSFGPDTGSAEMRDRYELAMYVGAKSRLAM